MSDEARLSVFAGNGYFVVARDRDDATTALWEQLGGDREEHEDSQWVELGAAEVIDIWCDGAGLPSLPDEHDTNLVTLTAAEWVERNGRGFLCTEEQ